jgi:nicotinamidase-related amidase
MSNTLNVLIVVDVQNCFMNHVFSDETDESVEKKSGGTFLNLAETEQSIAISKEIAELSKNNDITVFTRDYHPINHISFMGDENRELNIPATWPHHCRNKFNVCKPRGDANFDPPAQPKDTFKTILDVNQELKNKKGIENYIDINKKITKIGSSVSMTSSDPIKGTELSYFLYGTGDKNFANIVYTLNKDNLGVYKIGLDRTKFHDSTQGQANISNPRENDKINFSTKGLIKDGKTYVTLTKGEQCNKESYSAFNYHISYKTENPSSPEIDYGFDSIDKKNSTGLWEWILNNRNGKENLVITVCGLVGNVCVMHTVLEGIAMWETLYKIEGVKVEFQLSLKGTRFTPALPPSSVQPFTGEELNNIFKKSGNEIKVENIPSMTYRDWCNFKKPSKLENDAFTYFNILGYDGMQVAEPVEEQVVEEPVVEEQVKEVAEQVEGVAVADPSNTGGSKRTRKNKRNCSMKMRHKSNCKCRMCGGKKRTTKNRRITKRRRH